MIMEVETAFCKMYEQFQGILRKLEKAVEENTPIHEVEEEDENDCCSQALFPGSCLTAP